MKYFFGIHKDENDNVFNNYLIRKISEETEKQTEEDVSNQEEVIKKKTFPEWLLRVADFMMPIGFLIVVIVLKGEESIKEKITDGLFFFILGICLFVLGGVILLVGYLKNKHLAEKDEDIKRVNDKIVERINFNRYELNIPEDAKDIDFLFPVVKEIDGEEKRDIWQAVCSYNYELIVFIENNLFSFCDHHGVYGVPLEAFKKIVLLKRRQIFMPWNKKDGVKSDKYKSYKIKNTNQGFSCKCYGIILVLDEIEYQIIIPNYELMEFKKILDLPIIEEE